MFYATAKLTGNVVLVADLDDTHAHLIDCAGKSFDVLRSWFDADYRDSTASEARFYERVAPVKKIS